MLTEFLQVQNFLSQFIYTVKLPVPLMSKTRPKTPHSKQKILLLSSLTLHHLFIRPDGTGGFSASYSVLYPFVSSAWLATVHGNESLVRFKVPGVWYTILTILTRALLGCPVSWRSCGFRQQDQFLHEL